MFTTTSKAFIPNFLIYNNINDLLYPLFKFTNETVGTISNKNLVGDKYLTLLERGLKHISITYPDFFSALKSVTRGFLVFRQPSMNSFSSESAHGISFLSVPDYVSVPYFVEDIAHQCGHIVFSSMFFRPEDLITVSPDTPISQYNHNLDDNRNIFVVFHAVFTEHLIATCLLSLYEGGDCNAEENNEIIGRLAFIMKKYRKDIKNLEKVTERTEEGEMMFNELKTSYKILFSNCKPLVENVNLTGQPYNFNYLRYKEANPNHISKDLCTNLMNE